MSEHIVERKPRPRDRVVIRLSGGRFFLVPEEAAGPLAVGAELSAADIQRLEDIDHVLRGRDKAMRMLSLRARSRREIDDALRALGLRDAVRAGLVAELEERGLVDDARFAREFVAVKKDVRRLGPHRLRSDLKRRGVGREVVERALASFSAHEQEAMARALAERQVRGGEVSEKVVRRVMGMLTRKGYDFAVVNRVGYDLARRVKRAAGETADAFDDGAGEARE
jgi:regulatory protein